MGHIRIPQCSCHSSSPSWLQGCKAGQAFGSARSSRKMYGRWIWFCFPPVLVKPSQDTEQHTTEVISETQSSCLESDGNIECMPTRYNSKSLQYILLTFQQECIRINIAEMRTRCTCHEASKAGGHPGSWREAVPLAVPAANGHTAWHVPAEARQIHRFCWSGARQTDREGIHCRNLLDIPPRVNSARAMM